MKMKKTYLKISTILCLIAYGGGVSDLKAVGIYVFDDSKIYEDFLPNKLKPVKPPNYPSLKDVIEYNQQDYNKALSDILEEDKEANKQNIINIYEMFKKTASNPILHLSPDVVNDYIAASKNYYEAIQKGEVTPNDLNSIQDALDKIKEVTKKFDGFIALSNLMNLPATNHPIETFESISNKFKLNLLKVNSLVALSQAQQQAFKTIHNDQKKFSSLNAGVQRSAQMTNFISSLNTQTRLAKLSNPHREDIQFAEWIKSMQGRGMASNDISSDSILLAANNTKNTNSYQVNPNN
ncbi:hypothetical protein, partial [Helicobacter sp. 13S00477-4]|uniref:hypothetical protein n=1 Tax=Helicobacter sp. 13S00477-4 TaxID=1905759 RepID=UPI00117A59FD